MKKVLALGLFVLLIGGLFGVGKVWQKIAPPVLSFTEQCLKDGNMWHEMSPIKNGVQQEGEVRPGCMIANGLHHFSDEAVYSAAKNPGETSVTFDAGIPRAGESAALSFSIRDKTDNPPELYKEHDRFLHVIVISKDMTIFRHVHPDDVPGFSRDDAAGADFSLPFTFPKVGEYLVAVDYAHQLKHESRQFRVSVEGSSTQGEAMRYESPAHVNGYEINLDYSFPRDDITTLRFTVEKDGKPVVDLQPYLGAAMHVAIVKNDLAEFIHTHGEVHPPGYIPSTSMQNHQHKPPPTLFGPAVEAHAAFPSPGLYTVFGEFKHGGTVVSVPFTVRIE